MTITRILKTNEPSISATPTAERTVSISRAGTGDAYRDGCALHEELAGKTRGFGCVVSSIRREVARLGGHTFDAEQTMDAWSGVPAGRADIVAHGGGRTGVIEVKVVRVMPENPRPRDAAQLGGYTALHAHWSDQLARTWAALLYVELTTGKMKVFEFRGRELKALVREAEEALAA